MTPLTSIGRRLRMLLGGSRLDRELNEEMRLHVQLREERLREQGFTADAARDAAHRRFGNTLRWRDESVDAWGWRWLEQFALDVRFGVRSLLKTPGFTAITVITLALATGATTAIFSILNSVLLRPLPFADPDRLVQVEEMMPIGGAGAVLPGDLDAFRKQSVTFEAFTGYGLTTRQLPDASGAERLTAVIADTEFFAVLGVPALIGRTFTADDRGPAVVISAGLWRRRFAQDRAVIGRTIALEGNVFDPALQRTVLERRQFTVLGVMPPRFQFPYGAGSTYAAALPETQTDVWLLEDRPRRGGRWTVTGRLKPGVTLGAAYSDLSLLEQRLDVETPSDFRPTGVQLTALADDVLGPIRRSLWLLFGAVGLVLAAACANVANLLLARTTARMREVVTRAALGAGGLRLVRQFLTESVVLALAGGLAGVVVAWWGSGVLMAVGSAKIPRAHEITLDWGAFAFLLLVCVVTAVLFGLVPALTAARADVQSIAREAGGHATPGGGFGRIRDGLVVIEVALAFVLAFGAVHVMRELDRLQRTETGMSTGNVLTLHLTPRVTDAEYYRIEERVAQLPGVERAGLIHMVPLQNWGGIGTFQIRGRPPADPSRLPTAELRSVTPGYFATLGIPILKGRGLTERDSLDKPPAVVISETLALRYFPGEDPIGRALDRGIIVGIAGDVRQVSLDRPTVPQLYFAVAPSAGIAPDIGMSLLVRTQGPPSASIDSVRAAVREVNGSLAIFNIKTMDQVVQDSVWELNLYRWLIGLFAALALVLAAIGLYGVMSYNVTSRTREFAVRLALGSAPATIARLVISRGVRITVIGLVVGAAAVFGLSQVFRNLPASADPNLATLSAISALLLAIAVTASAVPALRVARVDPLTILRHE